MNLVCFCSGVHYIAEYEKNSKCCLKIICKVLLTIVVSLFFFQVFICNGYQILDIGNKQWAVNC